MEFRCKDKIMAGPVTHNEVFNQVGCQLVAHGYGGNSKQDNQPEAFAKLSIKHVNKSKVERNPHQPVAGIHHKIVPERGMPSVDSQQYAAINAFQGINKGAQSIYLLQQR